MGMKISLPTKINLKKINYQKLYFKATMIALIVGFIMTCISIYFFVYDTNKSINSITTKAQITKVDFINDTYVVNITYEDQSKKYDAIIDYNADSLTINDYIEIKYNKNNPSEIITENHTKEMLILTPIGLTLLIGSAFIIIKSKNKEDRIQKLIKEGILIYADIEGIFANSNEKKKKGKLPYQIKAKYFNPEDNQTYTYFSENYYEDLLMLTTSKTITKVPVYLNKENTSDYYMDLKYIIPEDKNEQE